jgi:hypothetical protein
MRLNNHRLSIRRFRNQLNNKKEIALRGIGLLVLLSIVVVGGLVEVHSVAGGLF